MNWRLGKAVNRRRFIQSAGLVSAWTAVRGAPDGAAQATGQVERTARPVRPVRIRGQIHSGGKGLGRVRVSDGLTVVQTGSDGEFDWVSDGRRRFVSVSVPSGSEIPQNPTGTARFYQAIHPDSRGEFECRFELNPQRASDENHRFLLLADTQTQDEYEMRLLHEQTVPDVQDLLRSWDEEPTFGIACGDIMFDDLTLYPEYERAVRSMGIPFFQVVGNHDLNFEGRVTEASTVTFQSHFGPEYFSFNRGAVHYVILNDVFWTGGDYLGYLGVDALTWLEADLSFVEPGSTVVVALHIPALSSRFLREGQARPHVRGHVQNREVLYRLLEPFRAHLLSGHTHENEHVFEAGTHEHIHGTVCGAWWSGPICYDGTPNGYGVYEVKGEEVRWHYKATGFDRTHQLRVYPRGADPSAPEEIVANVWDWEPDWTVLWYEDGARRGAMARRTSRDPLSVALHQGPERPLRRPWVEPVPTGHLFYAPISSQAREVRVEAIDRFGRVYSAPVGEQPSELAWKWRATGNGIS